MKYPTILAVFISAFHSPVTRSQEKKLAGDDEQSTRAAIAASGANRESFHYYSCRYRITKAQARNYQDALGGVWQNFVSTTYRLAVDGTKEVFECLYGSESPIGAK